MVSLLSRASAEFLINMGPYQHVVVRFEEDTAGELLETLERDFTNELQVKMATYHTEAESWMKGTREDILNGVQAEAVEAVKALSATVVAEEDASGPEAQPAWQEPAEAPQKPWNKAPESTTDNTDDEEW
jgi:hypothetical protein